MNKDLSKFQIWERKLLDFTLRNNLLNARFGKRVLSIVTSDVALLEDALQSASNFSFFPVEGDGHPTFDPSKELVQNRLGVQISQAEFKPALTHIYRTARSAIEENGANSLFVALGMLRWFESPKSEVPRLAPLLLLPVEMVRHGAGYVIRTRDEEIMINITLIEFLRQEFHITIPLSNPLPADDHGVDVHEILDIIRGAIAVQSRWTIEEKALLGLFSFSKFVMWNDIHTSAARLSESPVVQSLVSQRLVLPSSAAEPLDMKAFDRTVRPSEVAVPISADSSQLSAIVEAGQGKSFILFGPPGTGKSQTITNIIANALYQGKRVLFVAEKMAALSVVQRRLEKIGLAPFCLELHSNKVSKKHVLEQLQQAIDVTHGHPSEDLHQRSEELFAVRQQLNAYIDALHAPTDYGLSLYECLEALRSIAPLEDEHSSYDHLSISCDSRRREDLDKALAILDSLPSVFALTGHPSGHVLKGLRLPSDRREDFHALAKRLQSFMSAPADMQPWALRMAWEKVQSKWFLPRFFARRSFLKRVRQFDATLQLDSIDKFLAQTAFIEEGSSVATWLEHQGEWRDWYQWDSRRKQLIDLGFESAVVYLEEGHSVEETSNVLRHTLFSEWTLNIIDRSETLRQFNGLVFSDVIERFRQLQAHYQELTKMELYCRLAARVPSMVLESASGSEAYILKRCIANGGRGTSIRRLFDQLPHLMPRLCPCMLMSPISVAQFIGTEQPKYDLVIFDEASQMPTSEAVGAIGRGEALVVVGDDKQMPPTSFFTSNNVDEEDIELDDLDSILDDCLALSMPNHYLAYHYRSRHESLISFSNHEFYGDRLFTFPSADDRSCKVRLVHVNGIYDKGGRRQNREEAQAVVNEVISRLQAQNRTSIGVVAFSIVQQNLIEDLLTEALADKPELEKAAYDGVEPIFIKNLENVQGDERDVILFSIGYGPDSQGQVSMNFGPLNNVGGERRLNVAVTRARSEMLVFTGLTPEDIDPRRTSAKGVLALRRFLQYAQTPSGSNQSTSPQQGTLNTLAEAICQALSQRGYEATTNVGRSAFKVDVAVQDSSHPDRYLLGILLDGPERAAIPLAYDRDISQPSVLNGLGWKVMRVWSLDWYEHRQRTLYSIVAVIEEKTSSKPNTVVTHIPEQEIHIVKQKVSPAASHGNANPSPDVLNSPAKVDKIVLQVITDQVALPEDALLRLAAHQLGFSRRGTRIDSALQSGVQRLLRAGTIILENGMLTHASGH